MKIRNSFLMLLVLTSWVGHAQITTVVNDDLVSKWQEQLGSIEPGENCIVLKDLLEHNPYTDKTDTIRTLQCGKTELVYNVNSSGYSFLRANMQDNSYPLYGEVQVGMSRAHLSAVLKKEIYTDAVIVTDSDRHGTFLFVVWENKVILINYNFYYGG